MVLPKIFALGSILPVFILLVMFSGQTGGCSCMPAHPQSHYCDADYVIIARILMKSGRSVRNNDVYKIEIKKAYKMSDNAQSYLKEGRVLTPKSSAGCGITLDIGKLYVIAGQRSTLTLCNYVKEYQKMTLVERRGFAGAYRKGCACNINVCFDGNCPVTYSSCNWSPSAKCETESSACVPSRGIFTAEGKPTKCHWRRTPLYKTCTLNP